MCGTLVTARVPARPSHKAHPNQPLAGPLHRLTFWTQRAKKTLGLAGAAATGVKIAPPDAAPGLISYQEVHSSTSEAIDNKKRRKGASPGRASQPDTSARDH
jgi:hypothetical protein